MTDQGAQFEGRVAVVTGGAGGIGRATSSDYLMSLLNAMGAVTEWRPGDPYFGSDPPTWPG